MSDLSHGHWSAAQAAFCHQQDGNEIQNRLGSWYQADLSHVTFTISTESLLDAHVHTQGSVTLNPGDLAILLSWKTRITLQARGLSWCIASNYLTINGTSNSAPSARVISTLPKSVQYLALQEAIGRTIFRHWVDLLP